MTAPTVAALVARLEAEAHASACEHRFQQAKHETHKLLGVILNEAATALQAESARADRLQAILDSADRGSPVYKAVERVLDEHSAWIARPDAKVTARIALAAGIAFDMAMRNEAGVQFERAEAAEARADREKARADEAVAEVERVRSDRQYVVGWNDGFAHTNGPLRFPTMLRKMWSGGEVQSWLDGQRIEAAREAAADEGSALSRTEAALTACRQDTAKLIAEAVAAEPEDMLSERDQRIVKEWLLATKAHRGGSRLGQLIALRIADDLDAEGVTEADIERLFPARTRTTGGSDD